VTADRWSTPALDLRADLQDGCLVVRLRGDVDMAAERTPARAQAEMVAEPVREVVIDLAEVGFLDSVGVRVLLQTLGRATDRGVGFSVRDARPVVDHVLRITGVADLLGRPAA
jgi:anti-anti-sigma factor